MGIFFALILGIIAFSGINENSQKNQEKILTTETEINKNKSSTTTSKPETIKEEIKPEPKEPETIKEETKPEPNETEPVKEVLKPELIIEETKEIDDSQQQGTSWLRLALYILGPILILVIGKYLYSRLRGDSTSSSSNNFMRKEFKEEAQTDNTEQQPAQDEAQTDNTEQQPTQDEAQTDNTEQQQTEEDENNNK